METRVLSEPLFQLFTPCGKVEGQLMSHWEVEALLRHAGLHIDLVGNANHRDVRTSKVLQEYYVGTSR